MSGWNSLLSNTKKIIFSKGSSTRSRRPCSSSSTGRSHLLIRQPKNYSTLKLIMKSKRKDCFLSFQKNNSIFITSKIKEVRRRRARMEVRVGAVAAAMIISRTDCQYRTLSQENESLPSIRFSHSTRTSPTASP